MQISEQTRNRVFQAAAELGYVPDAAAQALASGRSKTIGLLLVRRSHVIASDMFLTQVMEVLVREINQQGMRMMLEVVENTDQRESYLRLVRSNSIDGILYSGPRIDDSALGYLVEHNVPTVLMGALPGTSYYSVDVDNRAAAKLAVSHLVHLGHQRIGCITNAGSSYAAAVGRLQGYQDALDEAGLLYDPRYVRFGDFEPESGYLQMKSLLAQRPALTAVFVASDVVALGAMAAIREQGLKIPEDVALVGFDDVPVSRYLDPSLTTVHLPIVELAKNACEMLIGLVRDEVPEIPQVLLGAKLYVRKSCGAVQAQMPHFEENDSIFWEDL
jgi:LacI family transcriptional regulator